MTKTGKDRGFSRNLLWLCALILMVAAIFIVIRKGGSWFLPSRETPVVDVFRMSSPAVVNISAGPLQDQSDMGSWPGRLSPGLENFFPFLKERQSGDELNLGSGIIVDPRGYILTNEHVVANTAWIQVTLADGQTASGEVWGTEPSLDLAVIKIDLEHQLPFLEMGRSDDIMIGESIVVIGNPLKLGHTCTSGIVSALHRSVKAGDLLIKDLIQIDAAVNPGNSGGPLLNIQGKLIGITSALEPEAQGIGFAIPIDKARAVVDDLIVYRYVPTGWLGVSVEDLGKAADAFGLDVDSGVFLSRIEDKSPASGEFRAGDVIESWNGEPIGSVEDFVTRARVLRAGEEVILSRFREGGARKKIKLVSAAYPESLAEEWAWQHIGLGVNEGQVRRRARDGGIETGPGLFVDGVAGNSPAQKSGLAPGDFVIRLNREEIKSREDFQKAIVRLRGRDNIFVIFQRGSFRLWVTVPFRMSGERW